MKRFAVIGAGSWGTALAVMAGRAGHEVRIWGRNPETVGAINRERVNPRYLPKVLIPPTVSATNDCSLVLDEAQFVVLAVPSHVVRELVAGIAPAWRSEMVLISATKGIETKTGKRISEIVEDVFGGALTRRFVCISGPSFASEVIKGHPTAIAAASLDSESGLAVQQALSIEYLRIYTNDDLIGTELGGSVKNVIAIAAGMVGGLGFGSNSVAALITRGLAEMTRLATQAGGQLETLMGLAGLGDLVLTCTGNLSRNRFVGQELARGRNLNEIVTSMNEVAEGIKTTEAVRQLAGKLRVEMPITEEVYQVLYEGKTPQLAADALMNRPLRSEF